MFEKVCLTPRTNAGWGNEIDPGFLAESLIFYGSVYVVATRGVVRHLIQVCGPDTLVELGPVNTTESYQRLTRN